jgi:hypothetical protein
MARRGQALADFRHAVPPGFTSMPGTKVSEFFTLRPKARQGKARQGKARQGKARQGKNYFNKQYISTIHTQ